MQLKKYQRTYEELQPDMVWQALRGETQEPQNTKPTHLTVQTNIRGGLAAPAMKMPSLVPNKPGCDVDESQNPMGPNRCSSDDQCHGDRTCSPSNWCQGNSNC